MGTIIRLFSGASGIVRTVAGGWQVYAVVLAVGIALGGAAAYKVMDWRMQAAEAAHAIEVAKAEAKTIEIERAATEASGRAEAALQTARANVQIVTNTIVKKVPVYVTKEADARCTIPVGFVRVLDAAAAGRDVSGAPDAASGANDGPSGVALSDAGKVIAANYGSYNELVAQVKAWQQWWRDQQAVRAAQP